MPGDTLLAVQAVNAPLDALDVYFDLAEHRGDRLEIVVLTTLPFLATAIRADHSAYDWSGDFLDQLRANDERTEEIRQLAKRRDIAVSVYGSCQQLGMIDRWAAGHALYAHLAVLRAGQPELEGPNRALHGILIEAGTPALVLPPEVKAAALIDPERALIAWSPTPQAARAVRAALAFLPDTTRLEVVLIGEAGHTHEEAHLKRYLGAQAREFAIHTVPAEGRTISAALTAAVHHFRCDLMVMGGYGHSALKQRLFGGTTSTLLANLDRPILMSH